MIGLSAAIRGRGSMREIGPQTGGFRLNENHPLAAGLEVLLYAPAGYVDLGPKHRVCTPISKPAIRVGDRGAYFPYTTANAAVSLTPQVTHALGEWTAAGLTDFNITMPAFSTFSRGTSSRFHTVHNNVSGHICIYESGAGYNFSSTVMNNTGWHTHCITGSTGAAYSTGYIDGERASSPSFDLTSTTGPWEVLGDSGVARSWPDCAWLGFWSRRLSLEEQAMLGTQSSGFLWDLLYQEPSKTYFFPPGEPPYQPYLPREILRHALRTASWTKPTTLYAALYTSDPSAGGGTEVSGGSYARVSIAVADAQWTAPSNGMTSNVNAITFPAPTGTWGTVTHAALFDASTGGNLYASKALAGSPYISSGDNAPEIGVGELVVTVD